MEQTQVELAQKEQVEHKVREWKRVSLQNTFVDSKKAFVGLSHIGHSYVCNTPYVEFKDNRGVGIPHQGYLLADC